MSKADASTTDNSDRERLLSLFSANFNDGYPIESRVNSKDMWSASAIVEFIDEYVAPYTHNRVAKAERAARIDEANYIQKMFKTHLFDPTGTMGFDEHASSRSKDEIERALQYNHNHAWAAIRAAEKVNERLAELQQEKPDE